MGPILPDMTRNDRCMAGADLDDADLWLTRLGWRHQGPFGALVTAYPTPACHSLLLPNRPTLANLDFAALTVNPLGGFGPKLLEVYDTMIEFRKHEARQTGYPMKKLEGKERRILDKISAEMCR